MPELHGILIELDIPIELDQEFRINRTSLIPIPDCPIKGRFSYQPSGPVQLPDVADLILRSPSDPFVTYLIRDCRILSGPPKKGILFLNIDFIASGPLVVQIQPREDTP